MKGDAVSSALAWAGLTASESPDARQRVMSWSAHDLRVRATAHAATSGQPGFVPHDYLKHLDGLGIQATITAGELCTVGLWERTGGGYRILRRDLARQRSGLPAGVTRA
jgi:hypothetical protein